MRAKRPGANGNRGEMTQGANGIRGETTRYRLLGTISLNISLTTCHLQHLSLTAHAFLPFVQELLVMT
jgi:hypothetical protein